MPPAGYEVSTPSPDSGRQARFDILLAMVRVYRSQTEKKIAGICGGLGEAYRIDANVVRIAFVFLGIATGGLPLLVAYVVGWILIPIRPPASRPGFTSPDSRDGIDVP